MASDDTQTKVSFVEILHQAAAYYQAPQGSEGLLQPTPTMVVEALLEAEKAAKRQRLTYPLLPLLGQWRLCFATGTRKLRRRGGIALGKGFYLPRFTPAYISFYDRSDDKSVIVPEQVAISNQIQFSGLKLRFTGPAKYLGKNNILAFDFTHLQVTLFGRSLYSGNIRSGKSQTTEFAQESVANLPFFAFFLVTPDLIAARGRGGGLALWIRE
ncbi:hypothetical protein [Pantanalinema sp. GBBB05]|uniref:hypothetical protein n=1 Tax=Pantanalinema sp. GBBB05 TaxID=2604139 RepID=UPI001DD92D43|nr:hypothetical protein [Pantanalinema sp. GBBB05]